MMIPNQQNCISHQKEEKKIEQQLEPEPNHIIGYWTQTEHNFYIVFVDFFRKQINSKEKRRSNKIFKAMAKFIGTRNAIQCRSHHMKIIRTFRSIQNIVQKAKKRMGISQYEQLYKNITGGNEIFNKNSIQYQNLNREKKKTIQIRKKLGKITRNSSAVVVQTTNQVEQTPNVKVNTQVFEQQAGMGQYIIYYPYYYMPYPPYPY